MRRVLFSASLVAISVLPALAQAPAPQFVPITLDMDKANELIDGVPMPTATRNAVVELINRWEREQVIANMAAKKEADKPPEVPKKP